MAVSLTFRDMFLSLAATLFFVAGVVAGTGNSSVVALAVMGGSEK